MLAPLRPNSWGKAQGFRPLLAHQKELAASECSLASGAGFGPDALLVGQEGKWIFSAGGGNSGAWALPSWGVQGAAPCRRLALEVAIPNEAKDGLGFFPSLERAAPAVWGLGSLVGGSLWGTGGDRVLKNWEKNNSQSPH